MKLRISLIASALCLLLAVAPPIHAESQERSLMYSYQRDAQIVHVVFFDLGPGPVCHIEDPRELPKSARDFAISKVEFDHLWAALATGDMKQYERQKEGAVDTANSHIFTTAYLPDGEKKMYVVPKASTPKALTELVREIRAYNRD